MDIRSIAFDLNAHASVFSIGMLQSIRKRLKLMKRVAIRGNAIFHDTTIDPNGDWAFHYGGRSELQFNIGNEAINGVDCIRFGVAFSLEPSQTLPDVSVLYPKVRRFNDFISFYPESYSGYYTWYWNKTRTEIFSDKQIRLEYVARGWFVFFGKYIRREDYSPEVVLQVFDELLPLYEYVEGPDNAEPLQIHDDKPFNFSPSAFHRILSTQYSQQERIIDVSLRHMAIQNALFRRLCETNGPENVAAEKSSGVGMRIDVVVRANDEFWFYEVKTGNTARACLREALGQLLEYSFWPGSQCATRLVVVGEAALDEKAKAYLIELRDRFSLPIEYEQQVV
jgi:hypothetical protein